MVEDMKKPPLPCGRKDALVFLLSEPKVAISAKTGVVRLQANDDTLDVPVVVLGALAQSGLIVRNQSQVVLTSEGRELAMHLCARGDVEIINRPLADDRYSGHTLNAINRSESPLAALKARISVKGGQFLTQEEFDAGERLRLDFTRGMLMPRISANWQASVSAGRRSGEDNGIENLTTSALAARQRVESAIAALGSELGGVATDICCFLKGFEQVEMERKWPKRSAKFMLKAALSVLAMHYWPRSERPGETRHWGASDFRPSIGG
jgi:Domain of unknown function (DUF6456)